MTKLPEFLRSCLALRQNQSSDHPHAGLLAAFREQSLPARERIDLLEHLARCPECREVLAAASTPDVSRAPGIAWWKWRWAVAAAASCVVAALLWQPGSLQSPPSHRAPAPPPAPAAPKAAPKEEEPKAAAQPPAKKHIVPRRDAPKQPIAQAALPPPPEPVISQPERPPLLPQIVNALPPPPAEPEKSAAIEPPRDRTQLNGATMTFQSGLRAGAAGAFVRRTSRPERGNSRWNLDGALRKSDDGGKTWHTVQVDDRARWYALSAAGSNVWVGGANGALFHSVDDGLEWKPIIVADRNERLTDTITGIDARDENWVKLKTRSGDWLTTDGGAHWRRE
jgi:hypothetical protein